MNQSKFSQTFQRPFVRDYGMVFVLLLLVALFSVLTVNLQHPSGEAAGRLVADTIVKQHGDIARVIVVGRDTAEDRKFTTAVAERLKESGVNVLDIVNGSAIDARKSIQAIVDSGQGIDAIAGHKAKEALEKLLPESCHVKVKIGTEDASNLGDVFSFGRVVGEVYRMGDDDPVSEIMIQMGHGTRHKNGT